LFTSRNGVTADRRHTGGTDRQSVGVGRVGFVRGGHRLVHLKTQPR